MKTWTMINVLAAMVILSACVKQSNEKLDLAHEILSHHASDAKIEIERSTEKLFEKNTGWFYVCGRAVVNQPGRYRDLVQRVIINVSPDKHGMARYEGAGTGTEEDKEFLDLWADRCDGYVLPLVAATDAKQPQDAIISPAVTPSPAKLVEGRGTDPDGFRGLKWGDPVAKLSNAVQTQNAKHCYIRSDELLVIGSASIKEIRYCFYKDRFYSVLVEAPGNQKNDKAFKKAIVAAFGRPSLDVGSSVSFDLKTVNLGILSGPGSAMIMSDKLISAEVLAEEAAAKTKEARREF